MTEAFDVAKQWLFNGFSDCCSLFCGALGLCDNLVGALFCCCKNPSVESQDYTRLHEVDGGDRLLQLARSELQAMSGKTSAQSVVLHYQVRPLASKLNKGRV
mmetsp:Transcript_99683/g.257766  ORF Transcript_99683/g.257766 Transcript_99683/m.257766 type:complete len:102 (-) Transcript_99683:30-335(-)